MINNKKERDIGFYSRHLYTTNPRKVTLFSRRSIYETAKNCKLKISKHRSYRATTQPELLSFIPINHQPKQINRTTKEREVQEKEREHNSIITSITTTITTIEMKPTLTEDRI